MSTSAKAVRFDDDSMWVDLSEGWVIALPLAWFPRLSRARPVQRGNVEFSVGGLHWELLDEDISVDGLLMGVGNQTRQSIATV